MESVLVVFACACLFQSGDAAFGPKRLYSMDLPTTPVSVKVIDRDLIILGPWYIGSVLNIHWKFRQPSRMAPKIINKDIPNPRSAGKVPWNAFTGSKAQQYWISTWGSNKTDGAMYVLRPTPTYSVWKSISSGGPGWNYERAQWVDMNRDGRVDCLTARFRGGAAQLLWFQQPAGQESWGQQIIHQGAADGNFIGFVKGGNTYILVAGLQFSSLALYWTMSKTNAWTNSRLVRHRVVDTFGKFYDVQYIDLNKDGKPDILTTTVNTGSSGGHVLGYEVPEDLQTKKWKRQILASGFRGNYSPGKATAFWPNKWKKKSDRPSIFLSGAGEEKLFILSPKPTTSGWGYVKSSITAGTGMIGVPFIGDIDGDSYPEVFVPQGKKLIVYSYDYNAAIAEPPKTPTGQDKATPRPVVKYVPPFFRPGPTTPPHLIPRNATPIGPRQNAIGHPGSGGSQFGLSPGYFPQTVAPTRNLPPLRPSAGSSVSRGGNFAPQPSNLPANPSIRNSVLPGGGMGTSNAGVSGSSGSSGGSSNSGTNGFSLWPVLTNNGPVFMPLPNQPLLPQGNLPGGNPVQNGGNPPVINPWISGLPSSSDSPAYSSLPASGGSVTQNGIPAYPTPPPSGGSSSNGGIVPLNGGSSSNNGIVPLGGSRTSNIVPLSAPTRSPMEPVFEDETPANENYPEDTEELHFSGPPPNLLLSLSRMFYHYHQEAADACKFEKKSLCSLKQLEAAKSAGPLPTIEWGWYDTKDRAATIEDCVPGEVGWKGHQCYKGVIGHTPVRQATALQGYCCSILRGVTVTDQRYSTYIQAEEGCRTLGSQICSLDEMFNVWDKSSYKSDAWGWFKHKRKLIKMVHTCDPDKVQWTGYECLARKLVTAKITSNYLQEKAYCCHQNSAVGAKFSLLLTLFLLLSFYFIVL